MPDSTVVALVPAQQDKLDKVADQLEVQAGDLMAVLPPSMSYERFMRTSLLAIAKNPDLLECVPSSLVAAIIEAAEVGLEPTGSLNRAWLVPFKENQSGPKLAQLMIGYQGYADLMRDSGKITRVVAEVVYEGDIFREYKGTEEPRLVHRPRHKTEEPTKILYAYAIAFYADGGNQFEVMSREQIELIRAKSRQKNGPAWTQGYAQMCRKTVIRRLSNYTPLSERAQTAIQRDTDREFAEEGAPVSGERTRSVTERVRARGQAPSPPDSAPDAAKPPSEPPASTPTPETTATGQPEPVTVEGEAREVVVCGDRFVPVQGSPKVCELEKGHDGNHRQGVASWKPGQQA